MNEKKKQFPLLTPVVLLTIFIGLIYSNTFDCGWHLDDYVNITENPKAHLNQLSTDSIKNTLYAAPTKESLYRPLSYLSFALNWYWGQDDVRGYHVVNIAIHTLTACILFFSLLLLFETPNLKGFEPGSIYFVALLSTVLWAIHPIQTQAVTYIVQRMAAMAALFYIIGIFCYLKARLAYTAASRVRFFGLCGLSFLLAIGAKNNALMLPVSLLLTEFVFFRDLTQNSTQKKATVFIVALILVVAIAGFFLMGGNQLIAHGYDKRPFSLVQRLLTQPGVVLFYLSQIIYPTASRFSVVHDVTYSTSLFTPWVTLPSIVIILVLIYVALLRIKKNPVLAFAILFFLGNHVIESTILPLENVFEHRNYLPSLFLFFPIAIGIKKVFDYYRPMLKSMFLFLVASLCAMMIGLGMSTYLRNLDWRSAKTLWEDAMEKAPASARPHFGLAWGYYETTKQYHKAIEHYQKALLLKDEQVSFKASIYKNLAVLYYSKYKGFGKAVDYAKKSIEIIPDQYDVNLVLCKALCMLGRDDESLVYLDQWLEKDPYDPEFLYLKGFIALKRLKPEKAIDFFRQCLQVSPDRPTYYREIGICFTQMGYYDRGFWFLKRAYALNPQEAGVLLGLADNRIRAGRSSEASEYVNRLITRVGVGHIETVLIKSSEDPLGLPVFYRGIAALVSGSVFDLSEGYAESSIRLGQHFSGHQ